MKFKRIISMLTAAVLCVSAFAACGDTDDEKEDSSSKNVITQDILDSANSQAKSVFTAIVSYCEKYMTNIDGKIPDGELTDIEIVDASESDVVSVPDKAYTDVEDAAADIQKAVSVYFSKTEGIEGTVFSVKFENGFPKCVVWSKSADNAVVGGYPNFATEADWTLEKAEKQ